jgi:hypothetical protein
MPPSFSDRLSNILSSSFTSPQRGEVDRRSAAQAVG